MDRECLQSLCRIYLVKWVIGSFRPNTEVKVTEFTDGQLSTFVKHYLLLLNGPCVNGPTVVQLNCLSFICFLVMEKRGCISEDILFLILLVTVEVRF